MSSDSEAEEPPWLLGGKERALSRAALRQSWVEIGKTAAPPRSVDKGIGTKALGLDIAWGLALSTHPGIRASPVGLPNLLP